MTGIDLVIQDLADRVSTIEYMNTVYGRAFIMQEIWGDKTIVQVPKVPVGDGNYVIPLPKDIQDPMCFFQAIGKEGFGEFDRVAIGNINRQIAVTFWGRLGIQNAPVYLEEIKFDFLERLQKSPYVSAINSYVDDRYQDVFPDFQGYFGKVAPGMKSAEQQTQWLMLPNAGFRLVFTVNYIQIPRECQ